MLMLMNTIAVVTLTSWLAAVSSSSKADTLSSDTRSLSRTWKAKQANAAHHLLGMKFLFICAPRRTHSKLSLYFL